jgi:hypothetical protein
MRPGFPKTHEELRYPRLLMNVVDGVQCGNLYTRWLPDLAGGYGYPTFVFYQPLYFQITAFLVVGTGLTPGYAVWFTALLFGSLGVVGIYRTASLFVSFPAALCASGLYALTPYGFVNLYVRGDFSEFASMQLTPWCLYFALRLRQNLLAGNGVILMVWGLALSLAATVLTHPLPAIATWVLVASVLAPLLFQVPSGNRGFLLVSASTAFVVGLAISSPYWFPAAAMRDLARVDSAFDGYFKASGHVVYPHQFLDRSFENGGSTPNSADDTMSFQLGAIHLLLATIGVLRVGRTNSVLVILYVTYVLMLIMMLPISRPLWDHVSILRIFQFPWRLLAVTATIQALCIVGCFHQITQVRQWQLALATLVVSSLWYSNQFQLEYETSSFEQVNKAVAVLRERDKSAWVTHSIVDEFLPKTAIPPHLETADGVLVYTRSNRDLVELSDGKISALAGDNHFRIHRELTTEEEALVVINQFYFPGWMVEINGKAFPDGKLKDEMLPDGRISFRLPAFPNGCVLDARYAGPPQATFLMYCSVAISLSLTGTLAYLERKKIAVPAAHAGFA